MRKDRNKMVVFDIFPFQRMSGLDLIKTIKKNKKNFCKKKNENSNCVSVIHGAEMLQ